MRTRKSKSSPKLRQNPCPPPPNAPACLPQYRNRFINNTMTIIHGGCRFWLGILLTAWGVLPSASAQQRLGYWKFDQPDFVGEQGQAPLVCTNLALTPSFDGNAVSINTTNKGGRLQYRTVEANGHTNLNTVRGALRFWFKPAWASTNEGGIGPGATARLIEIGHWTPPPCRGGFWCLFISPDGCRMGLGVQTNGAGNDFASQTIRWKSNTWHEVVLAYSPEMTRIEIDNQTPVFGPGLNINPSPEIIAQGFRIGSDVNGNQSAQGTVDELETFDAPLSPLSTWQKEILVSAKARSNPPALTLRWRADPYQPTTIKRRELASTNWITLAEGVTGSEYTDDSVKPGQTYEYQFPRRSAWSPLLGNRSLQAACDGAPSEHRGNVILLVDEKMVSPLRKELERLNEDLVGDGWRVWRHDVRRHDTQPWPETFKHILRIKDNIISDFTQATNDIWSIFIIGNVAIPQSGYINPDGHFFRPWPADGYYADPLSASAWTDLSKHPGGKNDVPNMPGDGIFDNTRYPGPVRMSVGRVDFWNMPVFYINPPSGVKVVTEVELLRRYLDRNHAYRHRTIAFDPAIMAKGNYGPHEWHGLNTSPYMNAIRAASSWFGAKQGESGVTEGDFFMAKTPLMAGFLCGYGSATTINNASPRQHSSEILATPGKQPSTAFAFMDGSYFGQWNLQNSFLRAFLTTSNGGLGAVWMRGCVLHTEVAGLGEPVGEIVRRTVNDTNMFRYGGHLYLNWMGDPTLRLQITDPPHSLTATSNNKHVDLKWDASQAPQAQYYVYRASDMGRPFTRLTDTPLAVTQFTDDSAPKGRKVYQVRALERVTTGCGSFTNLSQGVFVSIK